MAHGANQQNRKLHNLLNSLHLVNCQAAALAGRGANGGHPMA